MVCFLADHPLRLIPEDSLRNIIEYAKSYPTISEYKIFPALQAFFKCLNEGSPSSYPLSIFGYDGGLFEYDEIIDNSKTKISDRLFTKSYDFNDHQFEGVIGFYILNFYQELSPHLLGRLFESSISDQDLVLNKIHSGEKIDNLQGELGIVYTREVLASFASESVLKEMFQDLRQQSRNEIIIKYGLKEPINFNKKQILDYWELYLEKILNLKILDLAVGSGAFLVECFYHLNKEAHKAYQMTAVRRKGLDRWLKIDSDILRNCLYGKDIMSEAISISKLSLWLASAKLKVKFPKFTSNFIVGDSLDEPTHFKEELEIIDGFQQFDIIIGNPPWGATISEEAKTFLEQIGLKSSERDTYELFIHIALKHLKQNGRLCFILPHTLLYPEKKETRRFLIKNTTLEKWHYLGSDWFGRAIRMNTTMLQLKNLPPESESKYISMTLVDDDRKQAINGDKNLIQFEQVYSYNIPQKRSFADEENVEVELFRYIDDDLIMDKMEENSLSLMEICDRGRGVEMNKKGEIYQCPSCFKWDVPPRKKKGEEIGELEKTCSHCNNSYKLKESLSSKEIVGENQISDNSVLYIDGDSFNL
jgi:hypothetical protein